MTIKQWNVDTDWQEPFVAALRDRGADGAFVDRQLAHVDNTCAATGKPAHEVFGDPRAYASTLAVPDTSARDHARSRRTAIAVALLGLLGMFLTLMGWTGIQRDADTALGMNLWLPFVVGAVLTLGAALFDLAMGARSDVYAIASGQRAKGYQTFVNKFAPWVIVLLTLLGMLFIWLRDH